MKKLIITFKDSKEVERIEVEVPAPKPTGIEKLQTEVATLKTRITLIEEGKISAI